MENARRQAIGPAEEDPLLRTASAKKGGVVLLCCALLQVPVWGFQQAFGTVQQYEASQGDFGSEDAVGVVGTTMTGIIYIAMPFVSAILAHYGNIHRPMAILGVVLTSGSLLLAAVSTKTWHLICTLSILHAIGAAMLYISSMTVLNGYFLERKGLAFSVTLSVKASIGVGSPYLTAELLNVLGFSDTMFIWAGIAFALGFLPSLFLEPFDSILSVPVASRRIPWSLLKSKVAWIFIVATTVSSSGYVLPQTYLPSYANQVLNASTVLSSTVLALISAASVPATILFGMLCDGSLRFRGRRLSVHVVITISSLTSSLPVFFLWGFGENVALLVVFSLVYGFFAGGFSGIWSGMMKEVASERPSEDQSEAAVLFGLLNGGRGIGFVVGGLIGAALLENGTSLSPGRDYSYGYASKYGSMILFTGITAVLGGSTIICMGLGRLAGKIKEASARL